MTGALLLALGLSVPAAGGPVSVGIPLKALRERGRVLSVSTRFYGRAGNGEGLRAGGSLLGAFTAGGGRHLALVRASGDYGEFEDAITASNAFVHLRHQYRIRHWLLTDVFIQQQQDRFQRLNHRALAGAGPAFSPREEDRLTCRFGTAVMAEAERLRGESGTGSTARSSSYVSLGVALAAGARLSLAAYAQPRLGELDDVRVLQESAVSFAVSARLSSHLGTVFRYDSRPPAGVDRTDVSFTQGFDLTF